MSSQQQQALLAAEQRFASALASFRTEIDQLYQELLTDIFGTTPAAKLVEEIPGFIIRGTPGSVPPLIALPKIPTLADVLTLLAKSGIKARTFDHHEFAVATQPLDIRGNQTSLARTVDEVMVIPSIDAQVDFDTAIGPTTPAISGGLSYRHPQRTKAINFKATSPVLTGTLSFWSYWWD